MGQVEIKENQHKIKETKLVLRVPKSHGKMTPHNLQETPCIKIEMTNF